MLGAHGATYTLVFFGILFGLLGVLVGLGMREPPADLQKQFPPKLSVASSGPANDASPSQMVRSPIFWILLIMMTMMSTGGLMVISQFAAFARDFGVANVLVWGLPALPLALTLDRLTNGCTRPIFGWISDKIGRENTMALAFTLEALSIMLLVYYRDNATLFVLLSGLVFFGWGEIFTLFPSTLTDIFGARNATTNYGILYLAHGIGSVLGGPVAALIHDATGSWLPIFATIISMDLLTAFFAVAILKPMRRRLRC
jgi:MFS family permease